MNTFKSLKTENFRTQKNPWELEIRFLKGVGEKIAALFKKVEVESYWDLLLMLPRVYEDRRHFLKPSELARAAEDKKNISGKARILSYQKMGSRVRSWTEARALLTDPTSAGLSEQGGGFPLTFVWFGSSSRYVEKQFPPGSEVLFRGKIQSFRSQYQVPHPEIQRSEALLAPWDFGAFVPVYREFSGLSTRLIRKILWHALLRPELERLPEVIPASISKKYHLPSLSEALRELHFPKNWSPPEHDLRPQGPYLERVAFEELFMLALSLLLRRKEIQNPQGHVPCPQLNFDYMEFERLQKKLPFELTLAQKKSLEEILSDLTKKENQNFVPMHRLLQGDVGSGKTIVAFLVAWLMIRSGYQVALMAPTEILVDQHFQNWKKFFSQDQDQAVCLKGSLSVKEKKLLREKIAAGEKRLIVGTHALLTEETRFQKLGLVIVDEQHRFGVQQRLSLKHSSTRLHPHLLVMTATPIPRSLALTLYGDLSISTLREKPKGRQPVKTYLIRASAQEKLLDRVEKFLEEKRQIYVVYPLVSESEELDLEDAESAFLKWKARFPSHSVGLLHGKMKAAQKAEVMSAFQQGKIDILISTTVIEVGVDVPNASVMIVQHAERFGLSQLHQLKGRVGRGSVESYCILVGPQRMSPLVEERLRFLEKNVDGFAVAEKDLEIRGPGEFLGERQSGLPGFRVAHILRDVKLLERARQEAEAFLEKDPKLQSPEGQKLRSAIQLWWPTRFELTLSG